MKRRPWTWKAQRNLQIAELRDFGVPVADLAEMFGVSPNTVRKVVKKATQRQGETK